MCAGLVLILFTTLTLLAGYKVRPWKPRPAGSYPASLTSEGITIAADPLFRNDLAAQFFDRTDLVTRGIIPLVVAVFNDNDFPVQIGAESIELTSEGSSSHTMLPGEAVSLLFQKTGKGVSLPLPIPKLSVSDDSKNQVLQDFEHKFLAGKVIQPHQSGGGFLYFRAPANKVEAFLAAAQLYIPDVYRIDNGSRMIFFELELKPAITQAPPPPRN